MSLMVSLHGLDGSGKTTLALILGEALGLRYHHFPTRLQDVLDCDPSLEINAAIAMDMLATCPVKSDISWVFDRYIACHYAYGGPYIPLLEASLPPSFRVFIDCSPELSWERCLQRGDDLDISLERRKVIYERYQGLEWDCVIPSYYGPEAAAKYLVYQLVDRL